MPILHLSSKQKMRCLPALTEGWFVVPWKQYIENKAKDLWGLKRSMAHLQTPPTATSDLPSVTAQKVPSKALYADNCVGAVAFILRGAKKRRTLAQQRCNVIQEALGVGPETIITLVKP
jgi:hypothetical protein